MRVHASSINRVDVAAATGILKGMMEHEFPVTLGHDFTGVVESADAAPTQQSYDLFGGLSGQVEAQLARWSEITSRDLPALNELMRKENVPLISLLPATGGSATPVGAPR